MGIDDKALHNTHLPEQWIFHNNHSHRAVVVMNWEKNETVRVDLKQGE